MLPVHAKRVEVDKAEKLAQGFIQSKQQFRLAASLSLKYTATKKQPTPQSFTPSAPQSTAGQDTVYYYVFNVNENSSGGFVIVSGDDAVKPVLGYAEKGSYDENNLPPNFAWWMDGMQRQIAYAQSHNLPQSDAVKSEWDSYLNGTASATASAAGPLIQTQWDQGAPYNNLCPTIGGTTAPTGCVVTAMAQIMKYYNFPASGSGNSAAYTTPSGINMPSVSFETNYDWANMQNTYNGSETAQQQNAVATLMYHCGLSVQMQYDLYESAAYNENVSNALINNFGYDRSMQLKYRSSYSDADWENMLRTQIDAGLPVYYAGQDTIAGGHVFLCDGYDNTGKFHFNWGWSGAYDGYFATTALNAGSYDFSYGQEIITDIKPVNGLLKQLNVSAGTLSPTFRPFVFDYTLQVDASVETINIAGITDIPGATVTGNVTGLPLKLNDYTDVSITVTNASGDSQTYTIAVIRGILPPVTFTYQITDEAVGQEVAMVFATYDESIVIDWGDGSRDSLVDLSWIGFPYGATHIYNATGSYTVTICDTDDYYCPLIGLIANMTYEGNNTYAAAAKENVYVTSVDFRKATSLLQLYVYNPAYNPNIQYFSQLDISHNRNLLALYCDNYQLTSLDISKNMALNVLVCDRNQLTNLDVSKNTELSYLSCGDNPLSNLDVSKNTMLTSLVCVGSNLTNLDVSKNTALTYLGCENNNQITNLDVSNNTALITLDCFNNQLINLDVSKNMALIALNCSGNQLTNLDVINHPALTDLECNNNQLTNLNASNDPVLNTLSCYDNQLTNLNVSSDTALMYLYCFQNQLTDLDVSKNTVLGLLYCDNNQLTNLDVSRNLALYGLGCSVNQLTNLDISKNTALTQLLCHDNQLGNLDVSKNTALTYLWCSLDQLTNLDVSKNISLNYLKCDFNQLTDLDITKNTALTDLECYYNQITKLDVTNNIALTRLHCLSNRLTSLDVSKCTALTYLDCSLNAIPLINLYTIAQRTDITNKQLGGQTLPDSTVFANTPIAIDTVFYGVNTTCNYPLNNGKITFPTQGDYSVQVSNPALLDGSIYQTFHVIEQENSITNIPQEKPLSAQVQNGKLHVTGLTAGKSWSIYNASGSLMHQSAATGEQADIPLSVRGVYFVQSGKQVIKIVY